LNLFPAAADEASGCECHIPQTGETTMIRKLVLALGIAATLGTVALAPTSASAWGFKHHHHHFRHFGIYAPIYAEGPECYVVQKTFVTRSGRIGVRNVTVCD
jgi:hypothetical protein